GVPVHSKPPRARRVAEQVRRGGRPVREAQVDVEEPNIGTRGDGAALEAGHAGRLGRARHAANRDIRTYPRRLVDGVGSASKDVMDGELLFLARGGLGGGKVLRAKTAAATVRRVAVLIIGPRLEVDLGSWFPGVIISFGGAGRLGARTDQ
ncbi:hypothetical protein CTA1_6316, partial [Colletotrichum tanaceti]